MAYCFLLCFNSPKSESSPVRPDRYPLVNWDPQGEAVEFDFTREKGLKIRGRVSRTINPEPIAGD